jgi:hypothetical protein
MRENSRHPQVFSSVLISLVKDQPLLLQQVAGMLEALVHSGRTLEVAYIADHIVFLVGVNCSTTTGSDIRDRILLVAFSSEATVYG